MPGTSLGLMYTFLSKIEQDPGFHEVYTKREENLIK